MRTRERGERSKKKTIGLSVRGGGMKREKERETDRERECEREGGDGERGTERRRAKICERRG